MPPPTPDVEVPEPGTRVRAIRWGVSNSSIDDNLTVPPGTEGTVVSVDAIGTIHVLWDNRTRLGLLAGQDQWEEVRNG